MQNHSDKWTRYAANGDFRMDTRAVINGKEYSTITAPIITNGLLPDKELSVGNCISGTCTFTVMTNDIIPRSAEVIIKGRIIDDEHYVDWQNGLIPESEAFSEWLEFGHFWIDKRVVNDGLDEKLVDIECFDAMLKGNQAYSDNSPSLEWPKPMTTVVNRIAQQMGVQIDSRTVIKTGTDYVVYKPDDDATLLDILRWIGEIHGGNWTMTPDNKLRLVPLISAPSETFYVVDENLRRIKTPEGDNLAWKSNEQLIMPQGIGYINVHVVLGDVQTFGTEINTEEEVSTPLGQYTGINTSFAEDAESYFRGIVGNGATASQTSRNYYSRSGKISVFRYDVPVTVPEGESITRVYLEVNGHAEYVSGSSEYMCVRLVSGSTYLSDEYNFKDSGTSNTTVTLECNTIPTVEQLASMQVECRLGYFGGAINGATLHVDVVTECNKTVTKITMARDSEHVYTAGTDGGIEIKIEDNPSATQTLCNALFAELNGLEYAPYEVTRAVYDPSVELGDMIFVGELVHSIVYTTSQRFDLTYEADVTAPGEEELDSEYPYQSSLQKYEYKLSSLGAEVSALGPELRSEIRQTQDSILATVAETYVDDTTYDAFVSSTTLTLTQHGANITSIQQNYTQKNQVRSQFAIDPTNITLTAGQDQHGNPTGRITFNAGTLLVNSTNFSLDANGILTCNGANINGIMTTQNDTLKTVNDAGELRFYRNNTLYGKISVQSEYDWSYSDYDYMCSVQSGSGKTLCLRSSGDASITMNGNEVVIYGNPIRLYGNLQNGQTPTLDNDIRFSDYNGNICVINVRNGLITGFAIG